MEVTARLNNLRVAPRKVRLVANLLKGLPVETALSELQFMSKACARPLHKLVKTAMADAEHNFKLTKSGLKVKSMIIESAMTYKRFMPRAYGRAAIIRRRGSNVIVTLVGASEQETPAVSSIKKIGSRLKNIRPLAGRGRAHKKTSAAAPADNKDIE